MSQVGFITILMTALGLSADCFAVALSLSISRRGLTFRRFLAYPVAFGLFQAAMLLIGWLAGRTVVDFIAAYDHWLAFGLLAAIGGRMLWEFFRHEDEGRRRDAARWFTVIALSVATSIDALAVGLSYAFLRVDIALAAVVTGLAAFAVTVIGHFIGRRVGPYAGRWAELAGGVILLIIGLRILLEHLL